MDKLKVIQTFDEARRDAARLAYLAPVFRYAKVKLTDNCNSKCITCDYWKSDHDNELTLEEFRSVLQQLRRLGVDEVMFTGGEPTMRAELVPVIRHAAELGFPAIGLTTNALTLPPSKIDQLLDGGLCQLVLSLEGLTVHDEVRGVPGNVRKVLTVLEHAAERRDSGSTVGIKLAMTLMERNLGDIEGVLDLARRSGAGVFFNLIDRGTYFFREAPLDLMTVSDRAGLDRALDGLLAVKRREPDLIGNTISSLEYARRYFDDPKQAEVPCYLGYIGVDIDANGDVYSNCWGLPPVGNVRQASLKEILGGDRYAERCRAMFRKDCPGCSCGYILNLAYHRPAVELDERHGLSPATTAIGYAGAQS